MENSSLLAISPLDGRYSSKVDYLSQYFSEAALMRYRILIEIEWFIFIFNEVKLSGARLLEPADLRNLRTIYEQFDIIGAKRIKEIEKTTNHDVKAVEYFIKESLKGGTLDEFTEFVHFGCTSEDVNNLAYSCMIRDFIEREYMAVLSGLIQEIYNVAIEYKGLPMLSRTHGQPATPTTLGKELVNYVARLEREMEILMKGEFLMGKMNGAVGNYNAHYVAYPEIDWMERSRQFVESLGLQFNMYTTQIEPHDCYADVFDSVKRLNNILLDFDRDMWTYIGLGYFKQKLVEGEVGSSTMPHKINPIDFENSEGNLGIANALLEHLSSKLQVSRMQRDLSDSTAMRNVGMALVYALLAYRSTTNGIMKCEVNVGIIKEDLAERWELLAEPIQMVMRKYAVEGAYDKLKDLTRGKGGITKENLHKFIEGLKIPAVEKKALIKLTPATYTGLAEKLVEDYLLKIAADMGGCSTGGCGSCSGGCG